MLARPAVESLVIMNSPFHVASSTGILYRFLSSRHSSFLGKGNLWCRYDKNVAKFANPGFCAFSATRRHTVFLQIWRHFEWRFGLRHLFMNEIQARSIGRHCDDVIMEMPHYSNRNLKQHCCVPYSLFCYSYRVITKENEKLSLLPHELWPPIISFSMCNLHLIKKGA